MPIKSIPHSAALSMLAWADNNQRPKCRGYTPPKTKSERDAKSFKIERNKRAKAARKRNRGK